MPGTTTHNFILFEALKKYSTNNPLIKLIKDSHDTAYMYAKKGSHDKYKSDKACIPAGCAYLGCFGPDLFYLEFGSRGKYIADLLHYNKTGPYMIWCLRAIKKDYIRVMRSLRTISKHDPKGKNIMLFTKSQVRRLAYCLGHISHIAADINVHPYVNSIVGAYVDNGEDFENARGSFTKNIWKFHNTLEHYQDCYVLHDRFVKENKFNADWQTVNVAISGANFYINKGNRDQWQLLDNTRGYYKFTTWYTDSLEKDKYGFFTGDNSAITAKAYYTTTMPSAEMMRRKSVLVQGGEFDPNSGQQTSKGRFDDYMDNAVETTIQFWREVERYLSVKQSDEEFKDPDMITEKKIFKGLSRHWNLDTGLAPVMYNKRFSWPDPEREDTIINIAGELCYASVYVGRKKEIQDVSGTIT